MKPVTMSYSRRLLLCIVLFAAGFFQTPLALSDNPVMAGRVKIRLSEVGTSEVEISIRTQMTVYSALKQVGQNVQMLARQLGVDNRHWVEQTPVSGKFLDSENEVDIAYARPGAARNSKGSRWSYVVDVQPDCQLVTARDSQVSLMAVETTDVGLATMIIDIELPEGATNAGFDRTRNEVTYDLSREVENGSRAGLEFHVDHKSMLMSSLAKNYSNPKFNYMWAARAVAKNTGDQVLNNYRVRFRVAEMGNWGAWQRSAHLYPGQTVVDPFYPIFDLEKIMSMNGSRPAVIEAEYEYETADGRRVQESDSFPVQILSRNEVVYSSLPNEAITGFADQFDFAPALYTSMTTPDDPVVQQLAGRVSGMAAETFGQSIGAIYSDAECVAFMTSMWDFMQSNRIAYQSPNGNSPDGQLGQHLKYARDVLRNRAGTCIDLSITWASVCEAAGLQPAIVLVPGHAFPAVRLPQSKQWLAVESTMLRESFAAAVDVGKKRFQAALESDHYLVDVTEMRKNGIQGLDLPGVAEDFLTSLGYRFDATRPATEETQPADQIPAEGPVFNPNGEEIQVGSLIGVWGGYGMDDGYKTWASISLQGEAGFELLYQWTENDGTEKMFRTQGTWGMREGQLVLTIPGDKVYEYPIEFTGNQLKFEIFGGEDPVGVLDRQN